MSAGDDVPSTIGSGPSKTESKIPKWLPVAMFAGTTVALAIPLLLIRRQRTQTLKNTVSSRNNSSTTHIHRDEPTTTAFAAVNFARGVRKSASEQRPSDLPRPEPPASTSTSEFSSPGPRELMSAISRVDYSTAIFAGKAFGIATGIVTIGSFVMAWGVKTIMGVEDTREFAQLARRTVQSYLPSLVASIHRRSPNVDADIMGRDSAFPVPGDEWNAKHSEQRLQIAYDKGGMELWTRTALAEMEAELEFERAKRKRTNDRNR